MENTNKDMFVCKHPSVSNPDNNLMIAYADIYSDKEFVCRVWLMHQYPTVIDFFIDWFCDNDDEEYKQSVLKFIDRTAKPMLKEHLSRMIADLCLNAYAKYQLTWMLDHGYYIWDIIRKLNARLENESRNNLMNAYCEFENATSKDPNYAGFGSSGEIWKCYHEFVGNEWLDEDYMRKILNTREISLWNLRDYCHIL